MNSIHESLLSIVKERRSAYTKSLRLLLLSVATLIAFQFLVFDPFISAQTRLIKVSSEQAAYASISKNIEARQRAYRELGTKLEKEIEGRLSGMMDGIADDLSQLTLEVLPYVKESLSLWWDGDATSGRAQPSSSDGPSFSDRMMMQAGLPEMPSNASIELSPDMVDALGRADSWTDIRELLQPVVQSEIIDVRFSEYNEAIQSFVADSVSNVKQASTWKPNNLEAFPADLLSLWAKVGDATREALEKMKSLGISEPEDEHWWWTKGGKQGIAGLELDRSGRVVDGLLKEAGYEALVASLSEQLNVLAEAEKAVVARQEEVQAVFATFQGTVSQLLGPLDWLPLNLNDFVFLMPLLVSCSLGGGVAWMALKRSRYIRLLDTAMKKSEEVRELGFTLNLDGSASKVRWLLLFCIALGVFWIVYTNMQLLEFVSLCEQGQSKLLLGANSYSFFLDWVLSLALLLGGIGSALLALKGEPRLSES